jgi:acyl transferase domain-containing protein/acyl carrier protein
MGDEFDIAIIGMSCRFPGARNVGEFWRNLASGVESITRLSDEEILESGVPASQLDAPNYVQVAPVLEEPGGFDAAFFGFSPTEARMLDPQHRILLELATEALEDAGCDPERFGGRVGVFAGAAMNTYFMSSGMNRRFAEDYIPTLIHSDKDFLSTRISYKLNLKGPSLTVQTACSTSLVAVHLARQSLLSGETDMALAGAISVRVPHRAGYFADAGGVTSPDGHVRAFDAEANGTVFGSGGGVVVLKRLADAVQDGDTIHAVIKGSAVNNDGAEKAGYAAPSVNSQADAVIEALSNAGVDADDISYIETHGSGTPVGDPIEIMALTKAFRASTTRSGYCAIGSVKTNVGHLDAAAGIAGLIKTVLALEHREIPATLHYSKPNPEIDFPSTPFFVNARRAPWTSGGPRRAGIMSTGMGGTNAHVVLEEAPPLEASPGSGLPQLLVFSARSPAALDATTGRMLDYLKGNPSAVMDDVAYTLQTGRKNFAHRRFLVCADRDEAIAGLARDSKPPLVAAHVEQGRRSLVLLLPGVGDHYVGMGHDLYEQYAVFRNAVDHCARILDPLLGGDIRNVLYPDHRRWKSHGKPKGIDLKKMLGGSLGAAEDPDSERLNQTVNTQAALFSVEYALTRLWNELGVVPDAIVGHSMGEYVAACLAGVMSLEDALRLIVKRARLVDTLPRARMLAVTLAEHEVLPLLAPELSIALINGPKLCVVAGASDAVALLEQTLNAKGVISRPVQNAHAFHSRMLDPIVGAFEAEVRAVRLNEPSIPFISNVSGDWVTKAEATDPAYWAAHANHTARFSDALGALWQLGNPILLEAGPGKTIGVLAAQHPDRDGGSDPTVVSSLRHHYENRHDVEFLLNGVGGLWASGTAIKWACLHRGLPRRKVSLPGYPFERQHYWIGSADHPTPPRSAADGVDEDRRGIENWFYVPTWERTTLLARLGPPELTTETSWLVFLDRAGGGSEFAGALEARGAAVRIVQFGDTYQERDDGRFEINPANQDDYLTLFRAVKTELRRSLNIVHLGCLSGNDADGNHALRVRNQDFGFFSLMHIAQAIGEHDIQVPVRIGVISNRIHQVTGDEALDPEMATVLGPVGVIPKEFQNVSCFNLDLPGAGYKDGIPDQIVQCVLSRYGETRISEVLALRGNYIWRRAYQQAVLPRAPARGDDGKAGGHMPFRPGGVYLITGGTGGIGLAVAKHLAKSCKARLVLTKKSPFPERGDWNDLLNSDRADESTASTIRALMEIEAEGASVDIVVAEASDPEAMRRAVDDTLRKHRTINGVIHGAGIVRPGLILAKTKQVAESVLAPKVHGAWILYDLLAGLKLDFLVLFSSITSIVSPYAEADYAAANAFLDEFSNYSNAQGKIPAISVNWPGWREVGQLANLQVKPGTERWKEDALKKAILTKDGLEAFVRALASGHKQIVVSPESLQRLLDLDRRGFDAAKELLKVGDERVASRSIGDPSEDLDQPTDEIQTGVARIWTEVLGHDRIAIHRQFSELGGHSLLAMQIVAKVRLEYQVALSLREFFASPTIAQLSATITEKIIREVEALSDDEAGQLVEKMNAEERRRPRRDPASALDPEQNDT